MAKLIISVLLFVYSFGSFAATCANLPSDFLGRKYTDKLVKVQVDGDGWVLFKHVTNGEESGWYTFNATSEVGKQYLSLLLTAGAASSKVSFYISQGVCNGNLANVGKFQIQWD